MVTEPARVRRARAWACAVLTAVGLAGCVDGAVDLEPQATASGRTALRSGVSPRGASVAFVSVEGAPPAVVDRFSERTTAEAARREITVADAGSASYFVRGYLSAYAVEGGAALGYVWDVFDKGRRRIQRTEDAIVVKGAAADPWSLVTDQALASLAAKSADDLAAILSNTPEAAAAAGPAAAIAAAAPVAAAPQLPPAARAYR
jgi:hypothetical protein